MEKQIKLLKSVKDKETGKQILTGTVTDLGKERNENAVKKGLAVWVDFRSGKEVQNITEKATEKKEGTPKKTTSSVKEKKIETK